MEPRAVEAVDSDVLACGDVRVLRYRRVSSRGRLNDGARGSGRHITASWMIWENDRRCVCTDRLRAALSPWTRGRLPVTPYLSKVRPARTWGKTTSG